MIFILFFLKSHVSKCALFLNTRNLLQLRKVTERVRPQTGPKVDERDSLLEQIRAKVKPNPIFLLSTSLLYLFVVLKLLPMQFLFKKCDLYSH